MTEGKSLNEEVKEKIREITDLSELNGIRRNVYERMRELELQHEMNAKGRRVVVRIQGKDYLGTLDKFVRHTHEYQIILDDGQTVRAKKREFKWWS